MINRSTTRDIPHFPVALYEVAVLFGTLVAETILASVHVRAHKQAGHMDASDLIKTLQTPCMEGAVHIWKINAECGACVDLMCFRRLKFPVTGNAKQNASHIKRRERN